MVLLGMEFPGPSPYSEGEPPTAHNACSWRPNFTKKARLSAGFHIFNFSIKMESHHSMALPLKLLGIALAGSLGTLSRFGLSSLVQRLAGGNFPWGTAVVNIIGCFLFGLIWTLGSERMAISTEARAIILTGYMGAFTTFSTFISETSQFTVGGQWFNATCNVTFQVVAGLLLFAAGSTLARVF